MTPIADDEVRELFQETSDLKVEAIEVLKEVVDHYRTLILPDSPEIKFVCSGNPSYEIRFTWTGLNLAHRTNGMFYWQAIDNLSLTELNILLNARRQIDEQIRHQAKRMNDQAMAAVDKARELLQRSKGEY